LLFKAPERTLDLSITLNKEEFRPGSFVEFEVDVEGVQEGEEVLVSVVVTDESVFQRLEEKLQPPTFGSAVFLAYDVMRQDYYFHYPNDYIEHFFGKSNCSCDQNLELLLGIQQWRHGLFDF